MRLLSPGWMKKGLTPSIVTVLNKETSYTEIVCVRKDLKAALNLDGEDLGQQEVDMISMMLYVKDRYHISGNAYHEFASFCHAILRRYRLKQKLQSSIPNVTLCPHQKLIIGVQQSFQECLLMSSATCKLHI